MARARPLPEGTVTFVFTDMEGSTRVLQALGDEWPTVLHQHLRLLRDATERHGGVEIQSDGDGLALAFADASSALAASVEMQRAMASHVWPAGVPVRVRIALHTGDVRVVNDDYVGLPLHIAARVRSVTHGGQIVLTDATRQLAGVTQSIDLGEHRLRDVPDPVRLHQALVPGTSDSFPPLRTLEAHPNNLPVAVDSFVGRRREMGDVTKTLATHRLVTLTGVGGCGKTRLALQIAASLVADYRDGVWLVELASIADPSRVLPAVAATLRVSDWTGESIRQALLRSLASRHVLLVLDNCEHVIDAAAELVDAVVTSCPDVTVLATSRELLGLRGETSLPVPPLSPPVDASDRGDAFELFVDRANAAAGEVDVESAAAVPLVNQLCQRLDGLPLALELAAARLRTMSLQQLVDRLDDRFRVLTRSTRTAVAHQRTLEAVVAWSYDLLADDEKILFRQLGMFPDTFTLDDAEAIAGDAVADSVLDVLSQLVSKSLVSTVARGLDLRYYLLETLRQYADERLIECGELRAATDRMLAWAASLVDRLEHDIRTPRQQEALALAATERRNLRRALTLAEARGDHLLALRLVSAVPLGLNREREAMLSELLHSVSDVPPAVEAAAQLTRANLAIDRGDAAATVVAADAAFEAAGRDGNRVQQAWARYFLLFGYWAAGRLEETRRVQAECSAMFEELDVPLGRAYMLWIGSLLEPDLARAGPLAREAERAFRALGGNSGLAHTLEAKALIALEASDPATARAALSEATRIYFEDQNAGCAAHCLEAVAAHALRLGRPDTAGELMAAARALRTVSGQGYSPWEVHRRASLVAALESAVGAQAVGESSGTYDLADAVAVALAHLEAGV